MKKETKSTKKNANQEKFPGYPHYGKKEDIYARDKEETELDPETKKQKPENEPITLLNEKDFKQDVSGGDLDIPGSELDDEQENIGSEDEENNGYSLGDTK